VEDRMIPGYGDQELGSLCRKFEESEDQTRLARADAERDRDYYDGKQLSAGQIAALNNRRQPTTVYNRIQRKVDFLTGLEKQQRKDPRAFPRNAGDESAAGAVTDALRFVCDQSRWDDRRSAAFENIAVEGTGAIKVGIKQGKDGLDPEIKRIAWDRFFADPHSSEFDHSDAAYLGEVIWQDMEEALSAYPDSTEVLETTLSMGRDADTYDDRPKNQMWSDYARKRVRIVEMYFRKAGVWHYAIFTKGGFLVEPQPSPYLDEDGQPECPIIAVSLYVDRENNRYGAVRTLIGPQDEVNARRSKALHLISQRQVRISRGAGIDKATAQRELSRPDGVLFADQGDVEVLDTRDMASANLTMLQEAKQEIDMLGANAALQGKNEADMSGRAILAQQQGGMVEIATLMDRVRCLSLAVYRQAWNRIKQYWTEERWVRVTEDFRNVRFVGINRPRKAVDVLAERMGVNPENFEAFAAAEPEKAAMLQAFAQSAEGQQVSEIENDVSRMDVDIVVDEGLDTPGVQAEQFDAMMKLASTGMMAFPPKVLIEASSLRDKDKLIKMLDEATQGGDPQAAMQAQMQAEQAKAEQQGQLEIAKATIKAESDQQIAMIRAETDLKIAAAKAEMEAEALQVEDERKRAMELAKIGADRDVETERARPTLNPVEEQMNMLAAMLAQMNAPRRKIPVRDENGFITEIIEVMEDATNG
jgi:hypothetical protein